MDPGSSFYWLADNRSRRPNGSMRQTRWIGSTRRTPLTEDDVPVGREADREEGADPEPVKLLKAECEEGVGLEFL